MSRLLPSLVALLFLIPNAIIGQRVSISLDGSPPDSSAILDVKGTSGGLLVPRMTMSQRTSIPSPATGLLVFQIQSTNDSSGGFFYYNGLAWYRLMAHDGGWKTDGNAGTSQDNFIGTTDNQPLRFRVHDIPAGMIDSSKFNTTFGFKSMYSNESGNDNTAIGFRALFLNETGNNNSALGAGSLMSNTTGHNNTVMGSDALNSSTEGSDNTASGAEVMYYNQSGSQNTASGARSIYKNLSGSNNSAFGWRSQYQSLIGSDNSALGATALYSNKLGGSNTAVGSGALYHNVGGSFTTAIGYHAMHNANNIYAIYANYSVALGYNALRGSVDPEFNSGNFNTAIGSQSQLLVSAGSRNTSTGFNSLYANTGGNDNTAVGHGALSESQAGNQNTAVGANAFQADTNYTNATAIGFGTVIDESNSVRLGNMDVTSIGGYADWSIASDVRFKTDIANDVIGIEFIRKLRPVTYHLDMNAIAQFQNTPDSLRNFTTEQQKGSITQSGFIAQEVESAAQSLGYDFSGIDKPSSPNAHYKLRYAQFVVPLVKAVQEQQQQIDILTAQVQDLIHQNAKLSTAFAEIKALNTDKVALEKTRHK